MEAGLDWGLLGTDSDVVLDKDGMESMVEPLVLDVMQAGREGKLQRIDRNSFRRVLGLKAQLTPEITILRNVVIPERKVHIQSRIKRGDYKYHNREITAKNFPRCRKAGLDPLVLAHFDTEVFSQEVKEWAEANGYEQADNDGLLAVGENAIYREWAAQYPIVQLGSIARVDGRLQVTGIHGSYKEYGIYLYPYSWEWESCCRFLLRQVAGC